MKLNSNINRNIIVGKSGKKSRLKKTSLHDSANNLIISRPLKDMSHDPSFKGLSFNMNFKKLYGVIQKEYKYADAVQRYGDEFGSSAKNFITDVIHEFKAKPIKGIVVKDSSIVFDEKPLVRTIVDSILYPLIYMPADLANYTIKLIKKAPSQKLQQFMDGVSNIGYLKHTREKAKNNVKIASLKGYLEEFHKYSEKGQLNRIFKDGHGRLDPLISNYSSDAERALTRFDTGLVAAFFLANDAHNLSRLLDDDAQKAKQEKKTRFKQEVGRVALTSYLTMVTMGALQKWTNKSIYAAAAVTVASATVSEFFGRLFAGKPILPLSSPKAKKLAGKQDEQQIQREIIRPSYNPVTFNNRNSLDRVFASFMSNSIPNTIDFRASTSKIKKQKPDSSKFFTKENILKGLGTAIVAGFAIKEVHKTNWYGKIDKAVSGFYKKLVNNATIIEREEFESIVKKLEENGFEKLAQTYSKALENETGDLIKLGSGNKKIIKPIVDTILFPPKFLYSLFMSPHKLTSKLIGSIKGTKTGDQVKDFVGQKVKNLEFNASENEIIDTTKKAIREKLDSMNRVYDQEKAEALTKSIIKDRDKQKQQLLRRSLSFIKKNMDKENTQFSKLVNKQIFHSMDNTSKSSYSNADLAVLCKMACSLMTSFFLISDNYNLVMLKTAGQDKELAEQKAKERTAQRLSRTFFSTYMIKLVNDLFKPLYNKSLIGTVIINSTNSSIYEGLTRKSVSLPIGESTRDEILKIEQDNLNAKGLKGDYFRFMSWLTGKKSLSQRIAKKNENNHSFTSNSEGKREKGIENTNQYFQMLK